MPPIPKGQDFAAPSAALAAADNGALWVIDSVRPLLNFQDGRVASYAEVSALNSTIRATDGSVWFAGPGKLWHFKAGEFTKTDLPSGADGFQVQAIAEGKSGATWVSVQLHGLFKLLDGKWTAQPVLPSAPTLSVIAMTSGRDGGIWAGYSDNRIAALGDDGWRVYTKEDGVEVGNVTALFARGTQIWAGGEYGLARSDKTRFRTFLPYTDHLFDGITGIVETRGGDLWLNGRAGIVHVSADEVGRGVADGLHRVRAEVFGALDGLQGTSQRIRPLPTAIEGTDGRLWFSTSAGFFSIDPMQIARNPIPPQLKIESLNVDGKSFSPSAELTLPKLSQTIRINYVGLSLAMAEKVRYRYKLDGVDTDWQEAEAKREALYTNLNSAIANTNQLLGDINSGKGSLGKLAKDPALANKLEVSVTNLNTLLQGLNEGKGSIGQMFVNRSLYDSLDKTLGDTGALVSAIRKDPKTYLTIHVKLF